MRRAILILSIAVHATACTKLKCWIVGCPDKHECTDGVDYSGTEPDAMVVVTDGALPDAGPDAPPAPPDVDRCIGPRGNSDGECDKDRFEPNDDLIFATVGKNDECDPTEKSATIGGVNDVDVFRTGGCKADKPAMPWVALMDGDELTMVRVCVFPTCGEGAANVYECYETAANVPADSNTTPTTSTDLTRSQVGFRGCCRTGPGRITAKVSCPLTLGSPDIDTYIWIDGGEQRDHRCHPYTVIYSTH